MDPNMALSCALLTHKILQIYRHNSCWSKNVEKPKRPNLLQKWHQQGGLARPKQVSDHRVQRGRAPFIPTYQPLDPYKEDDKDLGYAEPTESGSIIPPALAPNVNFDIISAMI